MAYSYDQLFAADPSNPANVARNAAVTIFAPGDVAQTPLTLTTPNGDPLANPLQVNNNGFGSAFMHATLDRVAWSGGNFTGFFTSYEGMKAEAVSARTAAQTAATNAASALAEATTAAEAAEYLTTAPGLADAAAVAVDAQLTNAVTSGRDIVAYGDSLTYGEGGPTVTYPNVVATLTELNVVNAGIRAEKSSDIAGRQGASPLLATITGGTIPASGSVGLTVKRASDGQASPDFTRLNTYQVNPVIIAGVQGTITNTSGAYTFARATAGSAVTAARPVPISTYSARTYGKRLHLIWVGTNNWLETDQVMGDIDAMIQNMDALNKRYLVIGPLNRSNMPSGSADHTAIVALEQKLAKQYGRRFVNIRRYLIDYGLADAAITATATDTTNISQDIIPDSLRLDAVHLKDVGYTIVGQQVAARLFEFGWVPLPTAPAQVKGLTATPANSNVALTWTAPDYGGRAITDYSIQYKAAGSGAWLTWAHTASTVLGATITGLTNGTAYDFRVAAINSIGTGAYSATSTASPVAPAVPVFNPLSFTETHLWYDPSVGADGATVVTLDDKGANNYDAVTVGGTPKFGTTALDGTPAIVFDGLSWIKSPAWTTLGSVPVTVVINVKATSNLGYVFDANSPNILALVAEPSGATPRYWIRRNGSAAFGYTPGADKLAHTHVIVFNGANTKHYVDGVLLSTSDQGVNSAGSGLTIGGYGAGGGAPGSLLTGQIGDIVLIKKALTDTEIADATYWGKYRRNAV